MNRYEVAKIVEWAGGELRTRKAMQKIVYLLQQAGCPLDAQFTLHHFGPYSVEVAQLTDEMVQAELLIEKASENPAGKQYNYRLSDKARRSLTEFELAEKGRAKAGQFAPHSELAKKLISTDVRELEMAATIVYFQRSAGDWSTALEKTCAFKQQAAESHLMRRAMSLAQHVVGSD